MAKVGRPNKFSDVEQLEKKIQAYFDSCYDYEWQDVIKRDSEGNRVKRDGKFVKEPKKVLVQKEPFTITGLALALGTSRKVLMEYESQKDFANLTKEQKVQISNAIKRAKNRCEEYLERSMLSNKVNATAAIFNAKNNYGWKDKTEVEQHVTGSIDLLNLHANKKEEGED